MVIGEKNNTILFSVVFLLSSTYKFFPKLAGVFSLSDCLLLIIMLLALLLKKVKLKRLWLGWILIVFIYLITNLIIFNLFRSGQSDLSQALRIFLFFSVLVLGFSIFDIKNLNVRAVLLIVSGLSSIRVFEFFQNYSRIKNLDDISFKYSSFLSDTNSEAIFFGSVLLLFGFKKGKLNAIMSSWILISFILCNSRSLIICFLLSIIIKSIIVYYMSGKLNVVRISKYLLMGVLVLTASYFFQAAILPVVERYSRIIQGGDASTEYRVNFLRTTIEIFDRSPIIGNGSGSLRTIGGEVAAGVGKIDGEIFFPHNMYAYALAEFGIVGLCLFLFPFLFIVIISVRLKYYHMLSGILYISAAGFFFMDFTDRYVAFLLSIMIICINHELKGKKHENNSYNIASYKGRSRKRIA